MFYILHGSEEPQKTVRTMNKIFQEQPEIT